MAVNLPQNEEGSCLKIPVIDDTTLMVQTSEIARNVQMSEDNCEIKRYSRTELEGLRNAGGIEGQMKKWTEVYCGLEPLVQENYDALVVRHRSRKRKTKKSFPAVEEYEENDRSDEEEYSSILKPAFAVTGEPNFDSGPPEDGFEYLRRVIWEAARLPKVKRAKVDESKPFTEQTNYMPRIPELAKCSEQLIPLKEWEDAFLADFSGMRMALSGEQGSSNLHEAILVENFDNLVSNAVGNSSQREVCGEYPTLSMVMGMDSAARVSTLKKRVDLAVSMSSLSRIDCLWLFALSAAVDSPLHADTCASFRSLLRKCALLRAEKSAVDEEVVMLNILATIAGRYFGQLEH